MKTEEAEKIVQEFKKYQIEMIFQSSNPSNLKFPESLLPYSKEVIKTAIRLLLKNSTSEEQQASLNLNLTVLEEFIEDDEANETIKPI